MTDIVERLRDWPNTELIGNPAGLMAEAADEIEQLRKLKNISEGLWSHAESECESLKAEIERLKARITEFYDTQGAQRPC